jgi:hypothetical protein
VAVLAAHQRVERTAIESVSVALLASFGVFLKPHFAVFPAVTVVYELSRSGLSTRALSRETWLLAAVLLAEYAAFLWLFPEYLEIVVPLTVATFLHYRVGFLAALGMTAASLAPGLGVCVAASDFARWLPETRLRALLPLCWLYLLAGVALVGLQGFGFRYTHRPRWMAILGTRWRAPSQCDGPDASRLAARACATRGGDGDGVPAPARHGRGFDPACASASSSVRSY